MVNHSPDVPLESHLGHLGHLGRGPGHVERLACKSYHSDSCLNRCSFCPGTPGSSQTANLFDVPRSHGAMGWDWINVMWL